MNQSWKQYFKKMELDHDVRSMQPGDYRKLTNGTPVQPSSSSYANAAQEIVCSLIGNQIVANSLPSGTNQIIGFLQDRKSNRAFYCAWNSTAANNSIYKYENGAIVLVMRTALFDWAQTDFVDMDIVGDILLFTNNRSEIKKINIVKAIAGGVYTPTAAEITLIKPPPLLALTLALAYDNNVDTNFIAGNYFQFFERYIYEDFDYSVFGPSSAVTNSWLHPSGTNVDYASTTDQVLTGLYQIDGSTPDLDGQRILLLNQTIATNNGIWVRHAGAWNKAADFVAGSVDITVYVNNGVSNIGQVWRIKSTNVGTIAATKIRLEGPNYITVTRPSTPPATVIGIEYAVRVNGSNEFIVYKTEKAGAFISSHTFYNNSYLFTVPDTDTFVWSDNVPLATKSLKIFKNRVFLFNNTEGYTHNTTTQLTLTLTTLNPGSPPTKIFKCAKPGGRYNVGIIWFDFAGRHSGVKCDATITIPDDFSRYKIHVNTASIAADIPSWAVRQTIVCTEELKTNFFISHFTEDIFYYNKNASGDYVYTKTLSGFAADGTLIDITPLTKEKTGYTFQAGDRIKIYDPIPDLGKKNIIDVEILGQDGRFLLTRVLSEIFPAAMSSTNATNIKFEIYTPKKSVQEPFFETGITGTGDLDGDVELKNFLFYYDATGTYNQTNPYVNNYIPKIGDLTLTDNLLVEMSVWNQVFPKWITQAGRPIIKTDSRQISKYVYLRWGQQYILNANFLGLNTFYALDEQAMPIENGAGTRLAEAGEVLVAVHEIETEAVYVGQGFVNTSDANRFLTKTDSVIGDARRYLGGHGSIHPASIVARDGKVYYLDARKGVVIRRSQDGLTVISDYGIRGLISTFCIAHSTLATSRIIAGWDPQYDCYCISFIDTSGPTGITLYFHEKSNGWIFQAEYLPEFWGILGQNQIAFLSGALWVQSIESNYNKFFGVQKNRKLEIEFSPLRSLIHIWDALEIDVENIYVTAGRNEDIVLLYHKNGGTLETKINYADFKLRESDRVWRSAFFRWLNDANFTNVIDSKYKSVRRVRGQSAFMSIVYNGTDRNPMKSVTVYYTPSMQSSA